MGTEVLGEGFGGSGMGECCFANVRLPLVFKEDNNHDNDHSDDNDADGQEKPRLRISDADKIGKWINETAAKELDTYLQIAFHAGALWVRLSGQVYVELGDFKWVGYRLKELYGRVERGEVGLL